MGKSDLYELNERLELSNKRLKILVALLMVALLGTIGGGIFLHQQTINRYDIANTKLKKDLSSARAALKKQKDDTANQIAKAEEMLRNLTGGASSELTGVLKDALKSMEAYSKSAQDLANYPETLGRPPQPQPPAADQP